MADQNPNSLSPEDAQALIHAQQQLYSAGDPRASKLYNFIVSAGYATKDAQGGLQVGGSQQQPQQPGFFESLGHAVGIGQQETEARHQDIAAHPVRAGLEAVGGPAYQAAKGLYGGFMRSTGELGDAIDALRAGNPASAGVHGVTAVPLVGPALNKMADQAPPVAPGQSYASQVISAATPGNIGTAIGTAAQVAPAVLGAADAVAPERAMIPTPHPVQASMDAAKSLGAKYLPGLVDGPPESLVTRAVKPGKNNVGWSTDVQKAVPLMKSAEEQLGRPIGGVDDALEAAGLAKKGVWQQYQARLGPAAQQGATIDGNQIADAMVKSIDKRTAMQNPALVERVKATADTYRRPMSLNQAEDFLQSANKDLNSYYAKNKVGQQVALNDPEMASTVAEAQTLRSALYSKLDQVSGPGAAQLKQAYGALTNVEKELYGRQLVAARQNPESLSEQLSTVRGAGKIAKGVLTVSPGDVIEGAQNIAVSRALKARNTSDAMIQRAFQKAHPAQPFPMPSSPRFAGLLQRGPIQVGMPDQSGPTPYQPPTFDATTRAQRLGLLLTDKAGGKITLPYYPEMSGGERLAALLKLLRDNPRPQMALPAKASAIPLPPPQ